MANVGNVNAPMGLRPVGTLGSAGYCGRIEVYNTSTSDANAIGVGDPVVMTGTSDLDGIPVATRFTTNGTTGAPVTGVMVGVVPNPLNLNITYRAGSIAQKILVDVDPNTIYEAQDGSTTTNIAVTEIGLNIGLTMGTVSTTTGNSPAVLNVAVVGTTTALECKLIRLSPKVGNRIGDYAKYEVLINNHQFRAGIPGL